MGKPLKDETGKVYGQWTVVGRASSNAGTAAKWLVRCSCGTESEVVGTTLRNGTSTRCRACNQDGSNSVTHGMSKTREYDIWCGIIRRTENEKAKEFKNYGGRGISMHKSWRSSFEKFLSDIGPAPKGTSIERVDNDGPYSPENCIWAAREIQARNTRQNVKITFEGETLCMADWATKLGIPYSTIADRVRRFGLSNPSKILFKGKLK